MKCLYCNTETYGDEFCEFCGKELPKQEYKNTNKTDGKIIIKIKETLLKIKRFLKKFNIKLVLIIVIPLFVIYVAGFIYTNFFAYNSQDTLIKFVNHTVNYEYEEAYKMVKQKGFDHITLYEVGRPLFHREINKNDIKLLLKDADIYKLIVDGEGYNDMYYKVYHKLNFTFSNPYEISNLRMDEFEKIIELEDNNYIKGYSDLW